MLWYIISFLDKPVWILPCQSQFCTKYPEQLLRQEGKCYDAATTGASCCKENETSVANRSMLPCASNNGKHLKEIHCDLPISMSRDPWGIVPLFNMQCLPMTELLIIK